jgi:hypothetical protein
VQHCKTPTKLLKWLPACRSSWIEVWIFFTNCLCLMRHTFISGYVRNTISYTGVMNDQCKFIKTSTMQQLQFSVVFRPLKLSNHTSLKKVTAQWL